ncbi:hypothetical protein AMK26_33300 [Streptomyces sp. CB03234]|uniref:acyltransferase domain-containing protein n=1 Tax=Streptomyces sp. (strain CB03234) TaxID=1703937 RepID=UPI000939F1B9|nr:acyltransferase domain-containing protein [Streptomyces sp. CB03234]OKJ94670.1 hypothetical protein AMK26_33300 [Streptomyces sp. CB03234]
MSEQHPDPSEQAYAAWLRERLERYRGGPVDEDVPLTSQGLDSVAALNLYGDIEEEFGPLLDPTDLWEYPTVSALARCLASRDTHPGSLNQVRAAFVFAGQGAQHPFMAAGLYREHTAYRTHLNEACEALLPYTGLSVVDMMLGGDLRIHRTAFTQPAVFAVEYAMGRCLEDAGVLPVAVLGHGIGEFAAATVAGALTLDDAAKLVALRGAFMQYLPSGGGMMATCATPEEAARLMRNEPGVGIGAVNAARATVLSGDDAGLERIRAALEARGIACRRLAVTHAFHSPQMEPMVPRFEAVARRLPGTAARVPFYSTVRGRFTTEPLYGPYWAEHITAPVRFAETARLLLDQQTPTHVVEIGPRTILTPFVRRMGGTAGPVCLSACRGPQTGALHFADMLVELGASPFASSFAGA